MAHLKKKVGVHQLTRRVHQISVVCSSNPDIGIFYVLLKVKIKKNKTIGREQIYLSRVSS